MSIRSKAIIETTIGLLLVFGYMWWIYPLYEYRLRAIPLTAFLGLLVYSKYSRKESWRELGFRWDNFIASGKIVFGISLISLFVLSALWSLFFPLNLQFYKDSQFWSKLFCYPFWALLQQYITLAFFFRRFREVFSPNPWPAILITSLTFSLGHFPNPPLIIFCFIGGIFWTWAYEKNPNLFVISLSHGVMAVCGSSILLLYMNAGPFADLGRWTETRPFFYSIEEVNDVTCRKKDQLFMVSKKRKVIPVEGWVAPVEGEIEKIYIRLGNKDYLAVYGREVRRVETFYKNPDYRYTGFYTEIPVADIKPGTHMLRLKVFIKGRWLPHYSTQRVWVRASEAQSQSDT